MADVLPSRFENFGTLRLDSPLLVEGADMSFLSSGTIDAAMPGTSECMHVNVASGEISGVMQSESGCIVSLAGPYIDATYQDNNKNFTNDNENKSVLPFPLWEYGHMNESSTFFCQKFSLFSYVLPTTVGREILQLRS